MIKIYECDYCCKADVCAFADIYKKEKNKLQDIVNEADISNFAEVHIKCKKFLENKLIR